jgi:hypothetical protein
MRISLCSTNKRYPCPVESRTGNASQREAADPCLSDHLHAHKINISQFYESCSSHTISSFSAMAELQLENYIPLNGLSNHSTVDDCKQNPVKIRMLWSDNSHLLLWLPGVTLCIRPFIYILYIIALVGWFVGWLVGCLLAWFVVWLVGWLLACLLACLVGLLFGWFVGWLVGWFVVWLVGLLFRLLVVYCLFCWLLVGLLVGLFIGWLVGWLVCW